MDEPEFNLHEEISLKILGWKLDGERRLYTDRKTEEMKLLPDLAGLAELAADHMKLVGFQLDVTQHPADRAHQLATTYTARLTRGSDSYESTDPDRARAICLAALKAVGVVRS